MYCLNIALGNISWRLLFKEEKTALEAIAKLGTQMSAASIQIDDDYGQSCFINQASLHGFMIENLNETKMAHIEMALHQERTRIAATKAAQSDPGLKEALRPSGPGIINPMGNGFRPPGAP